MYYDVRYHTAVCGTIADENTIFYKKIHFPSTVLLYYVRLRAPSLDGYIARAAPHTLDLESAALLPAFPEPFLTSSPTGRGLVLGMGPTGPGSVTLKDLESAEMGGVHFLGGLSGKGQKRPKSLRTPTPYVWGTMAITNPTRRTHIKNTCKNTKLGC